MPLLLVCVWMRECVACCVCRCVCLRVYVCLCVCVCVVVFCAACVCVCLCVCVRACALLTNDVCIVFVDIALPGTKVNLGSVTIITGIRVQLVGKSRTSVLIRAEMGEVNSFSCILLLCKFSMEAEYFVRLHYH